MPDSKTRIPGNCAACNAQIIFLLTSNNKLMPVNAESVSPEDQFFNWKKHETHFATCPKAEQFRKPHVPDPEAEKRRQEAEFRKDVERVQKEIAGDTRPFIIHNKIEITVARYVLLKVCSRSGMEYEQLVSLTNSELREWLAERGVPEEEEVQLSLI